MADSSLRFRPGFLHLFDSVLAFFSSHRAALALIWAAVFFLIIVWQRVVLDTLWVSPSRPIPQLRSLVFNLTDFGAVGDGVTVNTKAFEGAILEIRRNGGGQLNVEHGRWLTAPFNLTSHMTLFLAENAVILGINDESYWPLMPPLPSYGNGREHAGPRYGSLIHGQNLRDVVITGDNGTIDGQGQTWWTKHLNKQLNHTRGPLVQLMWSRDIQISGVTLRDSPFWTLHLYDCRNLVVRNVTILAPLTGAPNTDGIDPVKVLKLDLLDQDTCARNDIAQDTSCLAQCKTRRNAKNIPVLGSVPVFNTGIFLAFLPVLRCARQEVSCAISFLYLCISILVAGNSCENMLIEDSYISVGDDGIAIKSGWDQYGIAYARPSANIIIRNVTVRSMISAGVSIGSEMSGGVSNVTVENLVVWSSKRGIRIKTSPGRGGYIRQITYRNLTLENVRVGIVIKTDYNEHPDDGYNRNALPVIEDIYFDRIRGQGVRIPVRIYGSQEIPIRNVTFHDMLVGITYKKKRIFQCSYVQGRVIGRIFPSPCDNLDVYDEDGRLVKQAIAQNGSTDNTDYDP